MPRVPTIADVIPGAFVNIVLKADQPTGRTVSGTVFKLLTRGNHPRGIKVQLVDGRVGRVQSMAAVRGLPVSAPESRATTRTIVSESMLPSEHISLDAYITHGKPRSNAKGGADGATTQTPSVVTCPVCGDFNGDEAAVAHHVASHFND
ncbi:hypothetical protein BDW59DRAFT_36202 [Aspergillus cavernicola]|uniref:UBZ4-type domain-containing protein n=1 Tax=Aspergillus cavernicola TaxID=176166 RepID=A0ABR4IP53_9EURO